MDAIETLRIEISAEEFESAVIDMFRGKLNLGNYENILLNVHFDIENENHDGATITCTKTIDMSSR